MFFLSTNDVLFHKSGSTNYSVCIYFHLPSNKCVCEQKLGSPEAVTIATAGCSSAVRATVLYKSPQTASQNYPKIPLKSWHLWKAMHTLHEERNDAKKIHQSGGCLLGGPLVGIRRGSLKGSLKFEALSLSVFFSVFPWRSSFSVGSSEDFSFVISSSVFLNTLKNGQVRTCRNVFLINLSMYLKILYYVLWILTAREHALYFHHSKYVSSIKNFYFI